MKKSADRSLYRILDANFNRAKEGLRVCEDLCRYLWDQKTLTRAFKDMRHELSRIMIQFNFDKVLEARHIEGDVGKTTTASESRRKNVQAMFWANSQRVKESLRVLEEVAKLLDGELSRRFKSLRYKVYALEQKAIGR